MKQFINIFALCAIVLSVVGCDAEYTTYSGPNYIMFSDSLYTIPVQNSDDYYDVPVAATQTCDYDRTIAVEIIDKNSNAIEGKHYELETNTLTIKAGELATSVRVRGLFENIGINDSIGFALRLIVNEKDQWNKYGIDTKVVLKKIRPFNIDEFIGYALISFSTYMMDYMTVSQRVIRIEADTENANTLIMKNYFYDGYDVKLKLKIDDPLNPIIRMDEQVFASTAEAFGTIYGEGKIWMYEPRAYTSYYSTNEHFILHYMTLYVPDVGTVGTFVSAIERISDDEAEKLIREGY